MTIRYLQFAIQEAIDEKGVSDTSRVKIVKNKDGELEVFATERLERIGKSGELIPYYRDVRLGIV